MGTYTQYSATASSNNGAAPVGAPEGMAPGSTNDCLRELMATLRSLGNSVADGTLPGSGTPVAIARGGTGATTAAAARAALGLGTAATYAVGSAAGEVPLNSSVTPGLVPVGGIIMWWGAEWAWPSNYLPCDGNSGTPDLRGRVPMCPSGSYAALTTGGAETQATSAAGSHSHGGATGAGGDHSHGGATGSTALDVSMIPAHTHQVLQNITEGGAGRVASGGTGQSTTTTTTSTGGGAGHSHAVAASGTHAHSVSSDGSHSHTVSVMQPFVSMWMLVRVS